MASITPASHHLLALSLVLLALFLATIDSIAVGLPHRFLDNDLNPRQSCTAVLSSLRPIEVAVLVGGLSEIQFER
ncbi:hypothetical protein BKA70DRAFT_1259386 [Coprinopsis sp. MPI-PUGE-AT-0042]|nr:hypothetical protein BKA70DRAFT_1259386 [Coprinopsis sp. MPI-PUGE-AT-0042]